MAKPHLIIMDEIQDYITPLSRDEYLHLEMSLTTEGCRDSLIVWQKSKDEMVIVDGHNRHRLCQKHNIPFEFRVKSFIDIEHVKLWMIENQMSRRNLTQEQLSYCRGLKYLSLKNKKGGIAYVKAKGKIESSTSSMLAQEFKVSPSTIKRDCNFAAGLNLLGKTNPNLKMKILTGAVGIKKGQVEALSKSKDPERILQALLDCESEGGNESKTLPQSVLSKDEATLSKIKGMIFSTIKRAINNRDKHEIDELKALIQKLENELFREDSPDSFETFEFKKTQLYTGTQTM